MTVGLLVILVPLLVLVGSYLLTMSGRNSRLQLEVREERAMLLAESGVDVALHEARLGTLVAGPMATYDFAGSLPNGDRYEVRCTYLGADGVNNDAWTGDTSVDEADEDVFQVVSTGTSGAGQRRVAAYLGFSAFLAAPGSSITVLNQNPNVRIAGSAQVAGRNYDLTGALVGSGDTFGISIAAPATTANLLATMTAGEQAAVTGGLGVDGTFTQAEVDEIVAQSRDAAQIVVTNGVVPTATWGSTSGPQYIVYREGNLRITGNSTGAGLLVVNGDLTIRGTFTWYGVVIVTGQFACGSGTARIYGGAVIGEAGDDLDLRGTIDIRYSAPAIDLAVDLTGRYVAFNGWQEITTND
jgi:hypothetical protein